jgi:hypothetical protein
MYISTFIGFQKISVGVLLPWVQVQTVPTYTRLNEQIKAAATWLAFSSMWIHSGHSSVDFSSGVGVEEKYSKETFLNKWASSKFQKWNLDRSSSVCNEHILWQGFSVYAFVPLFVPDSQTDVYFYTKLEESHKIAFYSVQFPNESFFWKLVTSKCFVLNECVLSHPMIYMEPLISVVCMS